MWWLIAVLAWGAEPTEAPVAESSYAERRAALESRRAELAGRKRSAEVRTEARSALLLGVHEQLIPPWIGTGWDFYGTTQTPRSGEIACGYFVSTVLRDAGLDVERVRLAQQASEYIVKTFATPDRIRRFRSGDEDAVVDAVLAEPEGLYVVGLDYHVGFLVRRARGVEFCHSTFLDAEGVVCEDPRQSPAFRSNYHVFGPVLTDRVIDAWLDGQALPTVTR